MAQADRSHPSHAAPPRAAGTRKPRARPEVFAATPDAAPIPPERNRVGVVFVHGIGQQAAAETFLDWSRPMVELLTDWRADHGVPGDPVVRSEFDRTGEHLPFLELEIVPYAKHPAATWIVTEAWWAQSVRPPSLGAMTEYIRSSLWPIMRGIARGYRHRRRDWTLAVRTASEYSTQHAAYEHRDLVLEAMPRRERDWVDLLDLFQMKLTALALLPVYLVTLLVLLFYAPFRSIPIQALANSATLKSIDNYLTGWFGGLPDITDDPVQSANVRMRLVNAIRGLRAQGAERVVIVAHSGGAIVSFETLCDPAFIDEPVDKLITLGEGLGLGWRIESRKGDLAPASRLRGDLRRLRPSLRWVDFWSTYDPAPAGPISPPPGAQLVHVDSHVTVNRMSILEDHGGYWDNDEEFVIPVLQEIDTPAGSGEDSRFFRDTSLAAVRASWRRQRVGVLALWRWVATLAAAVPLTVATLTGVLGVPGRPGPGRLGADVAGWWPAVPGHEIIAGPLDVLSRVASWPGILPRFGEWAIGTGIIALAFLLLARVGVGRWSAWDARERRDAHSRTPRRRRAVRPMFELLALSAVGVAMAGATLGLLWR